MMRDINLSLEPDHHPLPYQPRRKGPLVLGWAQWLAVATGIGMVVVFWNVVVPNNDMRMGYWLQAVGPVQEARYGFHAEYNKGNGRMTIIYVKPGGPFDRAGVKPGWVPHMPSCFGISKPELLYSQLQSARLNKIHIWFFQDWSDDAPAIDAWIDAPE